MRDRFCTVAEVAEYTHVSELTIRRAIAAGRLRAYRINGGRSLRLKLQDADLWLAGENARARGRRPMSNANATGRAVKRIWDKPDEAVQSAT